ncbi:IclR family transcriptional regulator [Elioraea sp.]|uniref:IclR family transcriptional regulator n=1 Tax=Elioraea sp. TaxID=2185103 RepID=UPI0025C48E92|nr:helix-turn-helix domain-containing protein [Elioraea sp.]
MTQEAGGVAAVDRALAILAALGADGSGAPVTLAALAQRTGLYKSTILRLLESLSRANYTQRAGDRGWRLGPGPVPLADAYRRGFRIADLVAPVLRGMRDASGESASFYVRDGGGRLCLCRVEAAHPVRDAVREGDRLPLDRGAAGRAFLAFGSGTALRATAPGERVLVSYGERSAETAGVAAPVLDADDALAGVVGFSGPITRFTPPLVRAMRQEAAAAAARLTRAVGGDARPLEEAAAALAAAQE